MLSASIDESYWYDESAGTITALRDAAHNYLYALANSNAMDIHTGMPVWVKTFITIDILMLLLLIAWETFAVRKFVKSKKQGVTVLQMILMPILKWGFAFTPLVEIEFRWLPIGYNLNKSRYFVFDYSAGSMAAGGGGGLAYFLAVEITMAIAQIINFITQRKVTFKSSGSVWKAARWYVLAYIIVTVGAAALQGLYKVPIYRYLMEICGSGVGNTLADFATMLINCTISFWVFYPIMKWIFKK